jgi:hypothetical protein
MYCQYVVLREIKGTSESEVVQREKNLEKVRFELRNEEDDSDESTESDEEVKQPTTVVRSSKQVRKPFERYSSPNFHNAFVLTTTEKDLNSVREEVESVEGRL